MKLLYVSSIFRDNSYGEVSRKIIPLFLKYTNWDIYLFHINTTRSFVQENRLFPSSEQIKEIKFVPDKLGSWPNDDKFKHLWCEGVFSLKKYILEIQPDVVITLHNDKQIYWYSKIIENIRHLWKGKFIPYIPIDSTHSQRSYLHKSIKCDALLTMNKWSKQQLKNDPMISFPIYVVPHIVNNFFSIDGKSKQKCKERLYKGNANRYIVGCVNANNGRKRLDLIIETFKMFHTHYPNSMLVLKTTAQDLPGGNVLSHPLSQLEEKIKGYPIALLTSYLTHSELNELYNSFDIMINATDGEGFGLTPFEGGLAGVLSILPNNTSFTSLVEEDSTPNYLIPCMTLPAKYVRSFLNFSPVLEGRIIHSVYSDSIHYQDEHTYVHTWRPINPTITTYLFSTLPENQIPRDIKMDSKPITITKYFSRMEELIKADWSPFQIQVVITSDIETIRSFLSWMTIHKDIPWPGEHRRRQSISIKALRDFVGLDGPNVGIVKAKDICEKMIFYKKNPEKYKEDLQNFQQFIRTHFSEKKVWEALHTAITEVNEMS